MAWMDDPLAAWAASGAMAVTGRADGPALGPPRGFVERVQLLQDALNDASRAVDASVGLDVLCLLGERAALAGLSRGGDRSCGGATRLLPTHTGWLAVSLARPADLELLPAWLQRDITADADPWAAVAVAVADSDGARLSDAAELLGLPVAALPPTPDRGLHVTSSSPASGRVLDTLPVRGTRVAEAAPARIADLLVVDLSSLWAGPLCAHILSEAGAEVVKVEATQRPDGGHWGPMADVCVAILRTEAGRAPRDKELHDLVGELSTRSDEFRTRWGAHNVRHHGTGTKRFHHRSSAT